MKTKLIYILSLILCLIPISLSSQWFLMDQSYMTGRGKVWFHAEGVDLIMKSTSHLMEHDTSTFTVNGYVKNQGATGTVEMFNYSKLYISKDFENDGDVTNNDNGEIYIFQSMINGGDVQNYYVIQIGN